MPIIKQLIAETFGSHIGKYSERLKITQKGETLVAAPLLHLEAVTVVSRGVSISADALEACAERGIPVFFLDPTGEPYASMYASGLAGTVLTRREQLRAYDDERGFHLAKAFAVGKIQNQSQTLFYLARSRKDTPTGTALEQAALEVLDYLAPLDALTPAPVDAIRAPLMAAEGNAARRYWEAARSVIPDSYGWQKREGRGAADPINSLLNYGYGILYSQVERALVLAGLDPYAGFIHVDRPGKPSLVLDLIEEFRQPAVDRVVFGLATRDYAIDQDEHGLLTAALRKSFAEHILKHLEAKHYYRGDRHPLRHILQAQARALAAYLRAERDAYEPFKAEA